jgi:hypothetical protein
MRKASVLTQKISLSSNFGPNKKISQFRSSFANERKSWSRKDLIDIKAKIINISSTRILYKRKRERKKEIDRQRENKVMQKENSRMNDKRKKISQYKRENYNDVG